MYMYTYIYSKSHTYTYYVLADYWQATLCMPCIPEECWSKMGKGMIMRWINHLNFRKGCCER